jgi:transposase
MAQNFIESRCEQGFLLPPDVRDWLAEDHLAWFVIDAVRAMDLAAFYGAYRTDGHGRAAYEPSMMVTLLMYAYATKQRSSRAIESHCRQDVAYRVITGNVVPDHATIARFVVRHEAALAGLFGEVLRLCDQAGLVKPGLVAIDGTRLAGNASREANREFGQIAREILAEHKATDEAEDQLYGQARGDELPEQLRTPEGRREFIRQAKHKRQREETDTQEPQSDAEAEADGEFEFDAQRIVARVQGREGWLRDAKRQLEQRRWQDPDPVSRSRSERLLLAAERLEADLDAEWRGNEAYEEYRAHGRMKDGRRFGGPPKPYTPPEIPDGKVNVTDPDSKRIKANDTYVQGYNAQAVVDEGQIVLAAEITNSSVDWSQLDPMVTAAIAELDRAGVSAQVETAIADTQYWNEQHMDEVIANKHVAVLIPPDSAARETPRPGWTGGRYTWMRYVLASELGERLYRKRKQMIEPVFGHTKHNRGVTRFHRRGRTAVRTEWRLLMATHNLTKLYRHQIATPGA